MKAPTNPLLGTLAIGAFLVHGSTHIRLGAPEGMLWMCNMAVLFVAAGLLFSRARPIAIGLCWLVVGNILWVVDMLFGSELLPTSLLTHGGGLLLAIVGLRRLGFPTRTWAFATFAVLLLQEITRVITPQASNVNVAFAMYRGAERIFPSYYVYRASLLAAGALLFAFVEFAALRIFPPSKSSQRREH